MNVPLLTHLFFSCYSTDSIAQRFGFANAAQFVMQTAGNYILPGTSEPERWVYVTFRKMTRRLRVPKGAADWRFVEEPFGIAVTHVEAKNNGKSFSVKTPADLRDNDNLILNRDDLCLIS